MQTLTYRLQQHILSTKWWCFSFSRAQNNAPMAIVDIATRYKRCFTLKFNVFCLWCYFSLKQLFIFYILNMFVLSKLFYCWVRRRIVDKRSPYYDIIFIMRKFEKIQELTRGIKYYYANNKKVTVYNSDIGNQYSRRLQLRIITIYDCSLCSLV